MCSCAGNGRTVSHLRSNRAPFCTNCFDLKFQWMISSREGETLIPYPMSFVAQWSFVLCRYFIDSNSLHSSCRALGRARPHRAKQKSDFLPIWTLITIPMGGKQTSIIENIRNSIESVVASRAFSPVNPTNVRYVHIGASKRLQTPQNRLRRSLNCFSTTSRRTNSLGPTWLGSICRWVSHGRDAMPIMLVAPSTIRKPTISFRKKKVIWPMKKLDQLKSSKQNGSKRKTIPSTSPWRNSIERCMKPKRKLDAHPRVKRKKSESIMCTLYIGYCLVQRCFFNKSIEWSDLPVRRARDLALIQLWLLSLDSSDALRVEKQRRQILRENLISTNRIQSSTFHRKYQ